ncbi:MAG: hypothetical protein OEW70_07985 [candidate division WOR-3 bacterium]|nr:hypothetical protein [candidate division WOR-3 bacterium]
MLKLEKLSKISDKIFSGLLIAGLLLSFNCQQSSNKVMIPEIGFSMTLPTDWQIDPNDPSSYYEQAKKDDNWGMVIQYELEEGQTLEEYVDNALSEMEKLESMQKKMVKFLGEAVGEEELTAEVPQTRIIAKISRKISNLDAIEVIEEATYSVIRVYIAKDDKIIDVMFRTLPEDFPKSEPLLRKAIESIKFQE